jgi:HPt (histidine-containing phosphotransfer) domain-containing protein
MLNKWMAVSIERINAASEETAAPAGASEATASVVAAAPAGAPEATAPIGPAATPAGVPKAPADAGDGRGAAGEIFNYQEVLDTFLGEEEAVTNLLMKFIERSEEQLADIPLNIRDEDWESGRRNAHTIKGSALTLTARELGAAAARLEMAFKEQKLEEAAALYPPVSAAFDRLRDTIKPYLAGK